MHGLAALLTELPCGRGLFFGQPCLPYIIAACSLFWCCVGHHKEAVAAAHSTNNSWLCISFTRAVRPSWYHVLSMLRTMLVDHPWTAVYHMKKGVLLSGNC
jgi:hypothetical protein